MRMAYIGYFVLGGFYTTKRTQKTLYIFAMNNLHMCTCDVAYPDPKLVDSFTNSYTRDRCSSYLFL